MPYTFPAGAGLATPQQDHTGATAGGTVGVTVYANQTTGVASVAFGTYAEGVDEGNETLRLQVGTSNAGVTLVDYVAAPPPDPAQKIAPNCETCETGKTQADGNATPENPAPVTRNPDGRN